MRKEGNERSWIGTRRPECKVRIQFILFRFPPVLLSSWTVFDWVPSNPSLCALLSFTCYIDADLITVILQRHGLLGPARLNELLWCPATDGQGRPRFLIPPTEMTLLIDWRWKGLVIAAVAMTTQRTISNQQNDRETWRLGDQIVN